MNKAQYHRCVIIILSGAAALSLVGCGDSKGFEESIQKAYKSGQDLRESTFPTGAKKGCCMLSKETVALTVKVNKLIAECKYAEAEAILEKQPLEPQTVDGQARGINLAYVYIMDNKLNKARQTCRVLGDGSDKAEIDNIHKVCMLLISRKQYEIASQVSTQNIVMNKGQAKPDYLVLARDYMNRAACRGADFNVTQSNKSGEECLADYKEALALFKQYNPGEQERSQLEQQVATIEGVLHK